MDNCDDQDPQEADTPTSIEPPPVQESNPQQTDKSDAAVVNQPPAHDLDSNSQAEAALREKGISPRVAKGLAQRYPSELIQAKVELLDYLVEQGSLLVKRNPAGYLRRAIEEDYQPPKGFKTKAEREAKREAAQGEDGEKEDKTDKVALALEKYGTSEAVQKLWQQAQGELERCLTNATYGTYLRNAVLLSLTDGVATLGVANRYVQEWLEERLATTVCRVLEGLVDHPVTLKAVVL